MKFALRVICIVFLTHIHVMGQTNVYEVSSSTVRFHSEAQQELIKASSGKLIGLVDKEKRIFLFKISIASFSGFNSPVQKEHFNENYMESDRYPLATYSGKIIEEVDFSKDGKYNIRAKGKLTIHGVEQQRIIKCQITCKDGVISVLSDFTVMLADHNIKIPRIVSDKLSPEINVSVEALLVPKQSL